MKNTATWFVSSLALLTSCNYASSKPTLNSSKDSLFNILHSTSVKENLEEKAEILTLLTEAPTQQSEEENKSIFPYERLIETVYEPIIYGNLTKPEIALTFDDGHNKEAIKNILKLLKERDVKVTFFLIGKCIKLHKQLWEQAILD
jgi:peptidoglycan/xylan/chitin deacetylase (PgdA/CDA1 family)